MPSRPLVSAPDDPITIAQDTPAETSYNAQKGAYTLAKPIVDQIIEAIEQASDMYYHLVLVVAPSGGGKTTALRAVASRIHAPLLNVNLEVSRRMLDLTERQRSLQLPRLLSEVADGPGTEVVLLDNTELLFDTSLKQDPLRLLQGLSRSRTVVAAWSGSVDGKYLTYAMPDHLEYRRYPLRDFLAVTVETTT